jgi:hypothetical protein
LSAVIVTSPVNWHQNSCMHLHYKRFGHSSSAPHYCYMEGKWHVKVWVERGSEIPALMNHGSRPLDTVPGPNVKSLSCSSIYQFLIPVFLSLIPASHPSDYRLPSPLLFPLPVLTLIKMEHNLYLRASFGQLLSLALNFGILNCASKYRNIN